MIPLLFAQTIAWSESSFSGSVATVTSLNGAVVDVFWLLWALRLAVIVRFCAGMMKVMELLYTLPLTREVTAFAGLHTHPVKVLFPPSTVIVTSLPASICSVFWLKLTALVVVAPVAATAVVEEALLALEDVLELLAELEDEELLVDVLAVVLAELPEAAGVRVAVSFALTSVRV